jgi:hypothetical protein
MAKEHRRANRELKKPKQPKAERSVGPPVAAVPAARELRASGERGLFGPRPGRR